MSFLNSIIKIAGDILGKIGPLLPVLLGLIETKTDEGDREGLQKVFGVFKKIGAQLIRLGELGEDAISESSEGGTAITGNEYKEFAEEVYETWAAINYEVKKL